MIYNIYQRIKDRLLKLPLLTWVLLGFFITFLAFFIVPIFFDTSQRMQFDHYLPAVLPIGTDFRKTVSSSFAWIHSQVVSDIVYPASTLIFFLPFTLLDYETGYKILALITLLCYVLMTLNLPQRINRQMDVSALSMLIFITGLVSYGLQFELERGQFNVIALTFCLGAIYIFHNHPNRRWLAYLFFTISVQLKLYPAIFVFTLIEDWSDWKGNLKRIVGLGILNLAALFIFGLDLILAAISSMGKYQADLPGRVYSLSTLSFSMRILSLGFLSHAPFFLWLQANSWLVQFVLFAFFAVCFLIILRQAYKKNTKSFEPCVFFACTVGACIIPGLSFDYKLSLLPASVILLIPVLGYFEQGENKFLIIFLTLLFSIAYSSTLYPYTSKPEDLRYNFPALFVLLIICTVLSFAKPNKVEESLPHTPQVNSGGQ
jgi:hypothetical protein